MTSNLTEADSGATFRSPGHTGHFLLTSSELILIVKDLKKKKKVMTFVLTCVLLHFYCDSDLFLSLGLIWFWLLARPAMDRYQINFLWGFYLCSRTMFSERHHDTAALCQITDLYLITLLIIRWQEGFQVQRDLSPCLGTNLESWVAFFKVFTAQSCPVHWKHRSALTQITKIYEGKMSHT